MTESGTAISMERIRLLMRGHSGRTVIDKTDLKGLFDFRLQFTQEAIKADISPKAEPDAAPIGSAPHFLLLLKSNSA
jgi:uncharacterized protein (TIGR03435 family)